MNFNMLLHGNWTKEGVISLLSHVLKSLFRKQSLFVNSQKYIRTYLAKDRSSKGIQPPKNNSYHEKLKKQTSEQKTPLLIVNEPEPIINQELALRLLARESKHYNQILVLDHALSQFTFRPPLPPSPPTFLHFPRSLLKP